MFPPETFVVRTGRWLFSVGVAGGCRNRKKGRMAVLLFCMHSRRGARQSQITFGYGL